MKRGGSPRRAPREAGAGEDRQGVRIVVRTPKGPPMVHRPTRDEMIVGRSAGCDIVVEDPSVSRRHAAIHRNAGGWTVEDLGSHNGTVLGGCRIEGAVDLRAGDVLTLGDSLLVFDPPVESEGDSTGSRIASPDRTTDAIRTRRGDAGPIVVGGSAGVREVLDLAGRVAGSDATVLLTGESGTGKELLAQWIHAHSARAAGPWVVVNCPALPGSLFESEIFGVERGVATGVEARPGRLEAAQGGTVLLDEVGDLEPGAQAKILRVLQEKTFERVGGRKAIPLDARFLAATNHDLEADIEAGTFRRDLFHRLNPLHIHLPPLRERRGDIPLLIEHHLGRRGQGMTVSEEFLGLLRTYDFPGNVRELQQVVERAILLASGRRLEVQHLPPSILSRDAASGDTCVRAYARMVREGESFWDVVHGPFLERELSREEVRRLVERLHAEAGGSYKEMARRLGLDEAGYRKLLNFLNHHDLTVQK